MMWGARIMKRTTHEECDDECDVPEPGMRRTQAVANRHVVIRTLTTCCDVKLQAEVDVVDVLEAGVTVTLPKDPISFKCYRILASGGDVLVNGCCIPIAKDDGFVPFGTSRDFTFSRASERWIPACCERPTLLSFIGPAGVAGLEGAIGPEGLAGLVGKIGPAGVAGLAGLIGPQGIAGVIGAIGLQGLTGLTGAIGPAGVAGLVGAIGPQGIAGLVGEIGLQGIAGVAGPQGVAGLAGLIGPIGLTGPQGPTGPAGPPGPGSVSEYAYIYNSTAEIVAINDAVDFDTNGPITAGITHAPGSSIVQLTNAGTYQITYSVSGVEPNQFELLLNGQPVIETTYGSGAGTQQNTGQAIVIALAGSTLELRNRLSAAAVTLQTLAGGTLPNVNASLLILRLA